MRTITIMILMTLVTLASSDPLSGGLVKSVKVTEDRVAATAVRVSPDVKTTECKTGAAKLTAQTKLIKQQVDRLVGQQSRRQNAR